MDRRVLKFAVILAHLLFATQLLQGQSYTPRLLEFQDPVRDLGEIKREGGSLTLEFSYTNIADKPVVINDVHTRCGCFAPEFNTKPLGPGQSAVLKAVLKPGTLYGDINLSLTVIASNGDYNKYNTLTIRGKVVSDEFVLEHVKYPHEYSAGIRSDKQAVGMRLITSRKKEVTAVMEMYNDSDKDAVVTFEHDNKFLEVESSVKIAPKAAAEIRFTLNPRRMGEGEFVIPVRVRIDGLQSNDIVEVRGKIETR